MTTDLVLSNDTFVKQFVRNYAAVVKSTQFSFVDTYAIEYVHISFVERESTFGISFDYVKQKPRLHIVGKDGAFEVQIYEENFKVLIFKADVQHFKIEREGYSWELKMGNKIVVFSFYR
jgi:hypothetical protein